MFVNVLTNAENGRQRLYRKDRIITVIYSGKAVVTIRYIGDNGKNRSQSINYPSPEFALEQYNKIMEQLTNK
jgi:hypothetical protein